MRRNSGCVMISQYLSKVYQMRIEMDIKCVRQLTHLVEIKILFYPILQQVCIMSVERE